MRRFLALSGAFVAWLGCHAGPAPGTGPAGGPESLPAIFEVPAGTNAIQFRLYTAAGERVQPPCNTFEIEAFGEVLIRFPVVDYRNASGSASEEHSTIHSILVNGSGPKPGSAPVRIVERVSGPGWAYIGMDLTEAYGAALRRYLRGILFVEPDLFILADQIVAKEPAVFQAFLPVPPGTFLDPVWGDLRFESDRAGFRINCPSPKNKTRAWQHAPEEIHLPGKATLMQLPASSPFANWRLLTVFELHRAGTRKEMAFRMLEAPGAFGARIHRDGYPTLVAFKTDPTSLKTSLTGFQFEGPVGVDVFRPPARKVGSSAKQ